MDLQDFIARQIAANPTMATGIRKLYKALASAGTPIVKVYDGEEYVKIESQQDLLDQAFNLDELRAYTEDGSWVFVVMDSVEGILTDYTTNLEEALEPLSEWIDKKM